MRLSIAVSKIFFLVQFHESGINSNFEEEVLRGIKISYGASCNLWQPAIII